MNSLRSMQLMNAHIEHIYALAASMAHGSWLTAQNDRMFFAYHQNGDYRNAVRYVRLC